MCRVQALKSFVAMEKFEIVNLRSSVYHVCVSVLHGDGSAVRVRCACGK